MDIYSFSGPSGTGKSWNALTLAHKYSIEGIIDDGLLIVDGEILAGTSAKFEKSIFKAVKRAIFHNPEHAKAVNEAILQHDIKSILILGTSDKMTKQIAEKLKIGDIKEFHYIHDMRTEKEMKMAQFIRKTEGKHIMPIPMMQVQQNFFKRLVTKGIEIFSPKREKIGETTIVQPDFHDDLVTYTKVDFLSKIRESCLNSKAVTSVNKIQFTLYPLPKVAILIDFNANEASHVVEELTLLQQQINIDFNEMFSIEFGQINIKVEQIR